VTRRRFPQPAVDLLAHVQQVIDERDRTYTERDKRYQDHFDGQRLALTTALDAIDHRLQALNELRRMANDVGQRSLPREEYVLAHSGLVDQINKLAATVAVVAAGQTTGRQLLGYGVGVLGVLVAIVSLVLEHVLK
jgi:hypothetical protein